MENNKELIERLRKLNPQIKQTEEGKFQIFFDEEGLKEMGERAELCALEDSATGIKIDFQSKQIQADKLFELAKESFLWVKNQRSSIPKPAPGV